MKISEYKEKRKNFSYQFFIFCLIMFIIVIFFVCSVHAITLEEIKDTCIQYKIEQLSKNNTVNPVCNNYTIVLPTDFTDTYVKATTYINEGYPFIGYPYSAFNITLLTTNGWGSNYGTWLSGDPVNNVNQRLQVDLGISKKIVYVSYQNYHITGTNTQRGVKNFTLQGSNNINSFNDITYVNNSGWDNLTSSVNQFSRHIDADIVQSDNFTVNNVNSYRFYAFKFANNYGDGNYMGVRRIELYTGC